MSFHRKPIASIIALAVIATLSAACSPAIWHQQAAPVPRAALAAYVTPLRLDGMRVSASVRLTYWRDQLARTEARARVERAHIASLEAAEARMQAGRAAHPAAPVAAAAQSYGGVYGYAGIEALWVSAGGAPGEASTAACIAEHESGGRADAISPTDDDGIWQEHMDPAALNPATSALTAVSMSSRHDASGDVIPGTSGQDWSAWTTASFCT